MSGEFYKGPSVRVNKNAVWGRRELTGMGGLAVSPVSGWMCRGRVGLSTNAFHGIPVLEIPSPVYADSSCLSV